MCLCSDVRFVCLSLFLSLFLSLSLSLSLPQYLSLSLTISQSLSLCLSLSLSLFLSPCASLSPYEEDIPGIRQDCSLSPLSVSFLSLSPHCLCLYLSMSSCAVREHHEDADK